MVETSEEVLPIGLFRAGAPTPTRAPIPPAVVEEVVGEGGTWDLSDSQSEPLGVGVEIP